MSSLIKTRRWVSAIYLDYVRGCPCIAPGCASGPRSEAHHWHPTEKGIGRKPSDCWTVPLCGRCHRFWHDEGHLPYCDREESREAFVVAQWRLLGAWVMGELGATVAPSGGGFGAQDEDPLQRDA